jgi:RNA polymerase sigma factor (sigma-70 family)
VSTENKRVQAKRESRQMSPIELERPLEAGALREIERSLHGKLKAHRLSDSFIERCSEDAIQEGLVEYFHAVKREQEVDNRDAFVVKAAFFRAIDRLRREARDSDGAAVEAILESGGLAAPASDELAIEHLAAEELHEAIGSLTPEERQALRLRYFDQLSDRRSAEILYCSERTFRRMLAKAIAELGRRLGIPEPEPGSELAIEVGLAAWTSLAGARVVPANGLIDQAIAAADFTVHLPVRILGRARDLTARLLSSDASEKVTALAGGPAARAGGACAGAVVLCLATGAVGPGIGGVDIGGGHERPRVRNSATRQSVPGPASSRPSGSSGAQPPIPAGSYGEGETAGAHRQISSANTPAAREARRVKRQTDGLARAASESSAPPPPAAPVSASSTTEQTEASPPPSGGSSSSTEEAAQAKQQFDAFK